MLVRGAMLAALSLGIAAAQSAFDFSLLVTVNGISNTVPNNQTIPINAAVGTTSQATVVATYVGATQATISAPPTYFGSPAITAKITASTTGSTSLPIVLAPEQSVTFVVTYAPTSAVQAVTQVSLSYTEPGTSGGTTVSNAIVLVFQGASPSFVLSYVLANSNGTPGNVVQISPGQAIPFLPTPINTTAVATLNITDEGSGAGTITGISLAASPVFKLSGTPLFPFTLSSSNPTFSVGVLYTPTAVENDTGQITITYQDNTTATVNLTGSGATSNYSYAYLSGTGTTATPVTPGGTITFMGANVGAGGIASATSSVIIQVTNKGSVSGTINGISVQGQGFQLLTGLTTAPTLAPGGTTSFTIDFTPTQVGTETGTLVVGSDIFTLSGQGLGPSLTFAYVSSAGTIPVGPTGAVVFTPAAISQSEKISFILTNSGTSTATVSNISTTFTGTGANPFSVAAPALPLVLKAGQSSQFPLTFTPVTVGTVGGTLQIDTTAVPLLGTGTTPPALPSFTITGPSGNVSPASQDNVSLTLANPYPVDLNGVLTLTTSGNNGSDSSVQFSTGGRTVDFAIPANSTSANFAGQGSEIPVQTGTVAETVTLTPSFATTAGVDVTPPSPATLQFAIASSAPVLESLQVTNETASSFSLVITGYSTTRSLGSLDVTFTPASGYSLTTSTFNIDVSQVAALWFQSATSVTSFGGLFQITEDFTLPGPIPVGKTLIQAIASASVTVTNGVGTSSSLQANIQ